LTVIREEDLTPEDRKNGWTVETLAKYVASRERALAGNVFPKPPRIVIEGQRGFNPHKWGREWSQHYRR